MFSDVMAAMSNLLPGVYSALGTVILPFSAALLAVWFGWQILSGFLNTKIEEPWSLAGTFGVQLIKLATVGALLLAPLPRILSTVAIEPIFNIGLSINRAVAGDDNFAACVVATAVADPASVDAGAAARGAFSPRLRHNLACEVAAVHQMTGLGMTVGWTMMNMAFNEEYMHKIMWDVPIFPNVPVFFIGLLIMGLFLVALLPIPLYFLEIFITLSMDLIMLPLMLMGWLFKGWKIFPGGGGKSIATIIDDVVKGTLGIAVVGVFVTFALMFLNAVFGKWGGADALGAAIASGDATILMDGLMMRNDSLITIVMMGVFIAMFMLAIPTLTKNLFKAGISTKYYDVAKKNADLIWKNLQKWYAVIKK